MITGRGRGRPQKRDDATVWLKGLLSGGCRPMKEIERIGLTQGFGIRTIRRAKARLGYEICPMKVGGRFVWGWRDPSVIERSAPDAKAELEEKLMHRLDTIERLAQEPKASTSAVVPDGDRPVLPDVETEDADPNELDKYGFHTAPPQALGLLHGKGSIKPMEIMKRARALEKEHQDPTTSFVKTFQWAYPAAGLSESLLANMLRKALLVGVSKADVENWKQSAVPQDPVF
jgi:hypothetical protein